MRDYAVLVDGKMICTVRATSPESAVNQAFMKYGSASRYTGKGIRSFKAHKLGIL